MERKEEEEKGEEEGLKNYINDKKLGFIIFVTRSPLTPSLATTITIHIAQVICIYLFFSF